MLKSKITIIAVTSLALITSFVLSVPVLAADSGATQSAPTILQAGNVNVLLRLIPVQDKSKVDALLIRAVNNNVLTSGQARAVKDFWNALHTPFASNVVLLKNLLGCQNKARVNAYLNKSVQTGSMRQGQANKIMQLWEIIHKTAPVGATR